MANQKKPKRRSRKRTLPLFANPTQAQRDAVLNDTDELVRLAFPELTRCDHCGVLDHHTQRIDVHGEKRWLHEDCRIEFEPLECYPVLYQSGVFRIVPSEDELDLYDERQQEALLKGLGTRAQIGAVVRLHGRWYAYRHNASAKLAVGNQGRGYEEADDAVQAFHQE